jgi:hypothetical protein
VEDLKLEVTRLDSELWGSKNQRHFESKQHSVEIQEMKHQYEETINHYELMHQAHVTEMRKLKLTLSDHND